MSQAHKDTMLIITGAGGVLGRMLLEEAYNRDDSEQLQIEGLKHEDWDFQRLRNLPMIFSAPKKKVVINCVGIIRDEGSYSPGVMSYLNAFLPHQLAAATHQDRLIQISTDCVFNGEEGPYDEYDQPTPMDLYGRTKLAGELTSPMYAQRNVLTIRLSFIGLGKRGWLRRFMYADKEDIIWGYPSWAWNGLYARTAARTILDWALNESMTGLVHLEGPIINKFDLYSMLVERFRPEMTLNMGNVPFKNMVLKSNIGVTPKHTWADMLDELHVDWTERWSVAEEYWRETNASAYYHSGSSRAI